MFAAYPQFLAGAGITCLVSFAIFSISWRGLFCPKEWDDVPCGEQWQTFKWLMFIRKTSKWMCFLLTLALLVVSIAYYASTEFDDKGTLCFVVFSLVPCYVATQLTLHIAGGEEYQNYMYYHGDNSDEDDRVFLDLVLYSPILLFIMLAMLAGAGT